MKTEDNTQFRASKTDKIFGLAKDKNGKVQIILAGFVVSSKKFDTFDQADKYIGTKPYEIILNSIYVMIKQHEKDNGESPRDAKSN